MRTNRGRAAVWLVNLTRRDQHVEADAGAGRKLVRLGVGPEIPLSPRVAVTSNWRLHLPS